MKTSINGQILATTRIDSIAYADLGDTIAALLVNLDTLRVFLNAAGIPTRTDENGQTQVALRRLTEVMGLPHLYAPDPDDTFYIGNLPVELPPVPADPVGASVEPWFPIVPVIWSDSSTRSAALLQRVIAQFHVEDNPRYTRNRQGGDETYCNIFAWDFGIAMGVPLPHYLDVGAAQPTTRGTPGAWETDANALVVWLMHAGVDRYGWRRVAQVEALAAANRGCPAVACLLNSGGIGHIAVVRPGTFDPEFGLPIAQAGRFNFDDEHLLNGFGPVYAPRVVCFIHD